MKDNINNIVIRINSKCYRYFRLGILLLFLNSMYPWPMWSWKIPIIPLFACLVSWPIFLKRKYYFSSNQRRKSMLLLLLLFVFWTCRSLNLFGYLGQIIIIVPIGMIVFLDELYKIDLLRYVTKWFAILIAVSLFFYILNLLGLHLPYTVLQYPDYSYYHENHYFFVNGDSSYRFNSIFLEPGHLTMGLAPILFINKYNLRNKYVLVLFIAQIFSLSLAGVLVTITGMLFYIFSSKSFVAGLKKMIAISIVLTISIYGLVKLVNVDDLIRVAIIERLEKGEDAMNVRFDDNTSTLFNKIMSSNAKWVGWPEKSKELVGSGYKSFVIVHGIIGCLLVLVIYSMPVFVYKRRFVLSFFLILTLLLSQNAYPHWFCMLFSSCVGSAYLAYTDNKKNRKYVTENSLFPSKQ